MATRLAELLRRGSGNRSSAGSPETVLPQADQVSAKPSDEAVITALLAATKRFGTKRSDAVAALLLMDEFAAGSRAAEDGIFQPETAQLRCRAYRLVINIVLPHGKLPQHGSAGDLLVRHTIRPEAGETGFIHDQVEAGGDRYCTMEVLIRRIT